MADAFQQHERQFKNVVVRQVRREVMADLLDDATRYARNAREAGVDVALEIWGDMFHVFQMIGFLPEAGSALEHIARFVTETLSALDDV